jgi:hypothetical protein
MQALRAALQITGMNQYVVEKHKTLQILMIGVKFD